MPELPEVESFRKLAELLARGRRIRSVRCDDDDIVFDGVSPTRFARTLRSRVVKEVKRHGKHVFFELDRRPWPVFHFGMTGAFRSPDHNALELATAKGSAPSLWPPRFMKVHLTFDDGGELVMTNMRRLGRIRLRQDPMAEPPLSKLGFDPLTSMPPLRAFRGFVGSRKGNVKALLLDQSFAAGVGNWIADEVLYQARVAPHRTVESLTPDEVKQLHAALRSIVQRAVRVDARKERFPTTWLFHRRWGKVANATTEQGERIVHDTVAGRTTAWVPSLQR